MWKTPCYTWSSKEAVAMLENSPFFVIIYASLANLQIKTKKGELKMSKINDNNSLAHTTWNCKYHIVFAPKYRRQEIYGKIKKDIGIIIRTLCKNKGVEIIEAEACTDHIHMLVSIPPKISVSSFMGYLKGKSSLMIFDRHANLKYKYGNRNFWCRGYYADTVGKNKKAIENYIKNQLQEDIASDQMSFKEYMDPFTGETEKERKERKKKIPLKW